MKKWLKKFLAFISAVGLGGLVTQQVLEHQGVDPVTARGVGAIVEQQIDDAAARAGEE